MAEQPSLSPNSPAVQTHITVMQGVIQRMAGNSSSCKLQCIVSVAAVLIGVSQTENPVHSLFALLPLFIFLVLDTYYLSLELRFRKSYNCFVEGLHKEALRDSALYDIRPIGSKPNHVLRSLKSSSILFFYPTLGVMVMVVWLVRSHY